MDIFIISSEVERRFYHFSVFIWQEVLAMNRFETDNMCGYA